MRRVIVGTAGHIDHGKTTLVEALTGIDCDRWQEEKERGITIDLGFAHLQAEVGGRELQLGFVDVPGHERFIHNALAGLGGIRLMILVVAADEGVMPQTKEHLAICSLLQIPAGMVALTKSDLVDEETLELAQMELADALAGTAFENVPIQPVSAKTGTGVEELKAQLLALAAGVEENADLLGAPTRLPLDRAFHLKGLGVIATGTLMSGVIESGSSLERLPAGDEVRVRSVQIHGESKDKASAGERTSLQLSGVELEDLKRGQQLVTPGAFRSARSLLGRFRLLEDAPAALTGTVPIRFHLTSTECVGKLRPLEPAVLEPGQTGLVELRLDRNVVAVRGDRFVLRRPSPQTTLGGGEILDPGWLRRAGSSLERALKGLSEGETEALLFWIEAGGEAGVTTRDLATRFGQRPEVIEKKLEALVKEQLVLDAPARAGRERRWVQPAAFRRVFERAKVVLKEYFKKGQPTHGMPKAEALKRIARGRALILGDIYLEWLAKQKVLVVQGDLVNPPGRGKQLSDEEEKLSTAIVRSFDQAGLKPPSPNDVCRSLQAKPQIFEGVLRYLLKDRRLARVSGDLVISAKALETLRLEVLASDWSQFSVADFKDRYELSRKWAIPLLEHLDQQRVTRRVGNVREVLRPRT